MSFYEALKRRLDHLRGHYGFVFTSLVVIFALHPFVQRHEVMNWALEVMYLVTVLAILLTFSSRQIFVVIPGLGLVMLISAGIDRMTAVSYAAPLSKTIRLLFFMVVIVSIFRDLLRQRRVSANTILGACCVYLFMVLAWSVVFYLVEWSYPDSFNLSRPTEATRMDENGVETELVYFSLITITTVGYGDITPISPQARILSGLEGLIGQLFLAVVIARVVGMELAHRGRRQEVEEDDP